VRHLPHIAIVGLLCLFGVLRADDAPAAKPQTTPEAKPADVASADAILASVYDVISGPKGQPRDWDRFRSLFAPGARLIPIRHAPDGKVEARVLDVEGFVALAKPGTERDGFYEREIARRSEAFGSLTHVFSTYESRRAKDDEKPFARGINSFQLLNDGKRWWVVTIYWEAERPDNPVPEKYLR
jgi:hypothetical protein